MKNFTKNAYIAVAVAIFLSACSGGGSATSSAPAAVPVPTPADLQTSVAATTYSSTSAEYAFVSSLNTFRSQVGLGLLAQNALLDKSAQNHLQYILANDVLNGGTVDMPATDPSTGRSTFHIENSANKGFTGVQEINRAAFVGYTGGYVGEEVTFAGGKGGKIAFESLASTIYHRAGLMMQGVRHVGVAAGQDASQTVTIEIGYDKPQANAGDFFGVYPANNQSGVGFHTGVESPNPFPDLSTSNADFPTKTGYPVSVMVKDNAILEVSDFIISEAVSGQQLASRIMTKNTDPNKYLGLNIAFLVAKEPLKPSTIYKVSFSGKVNNVVVIKTWQFTTQTSI